MAAFPARARHHASCHPEQWPLGSRCKTASISNAGSSDWDVYLGGEDPANPEPYEPLGGMGDGQQNIPGDNHIYPHYPIDWNFATNFDNMDVSNPHPFLFSESGIGGFFDAIEEKDLMIKAHAPDTANAWTWINAVVNGTARDWPTWDMQKTYPNIEDAFTDSNLDSAASATSSSPSSAAIRR